MKNLKNLKKIAKYFFGNIKIICPVCKTEAIFSIDVSAPFGSFGEFPLSFSYEFNEDIKGYIYLKSCTKAENLIDTTKPLLNIKDIVKLCKTLNNYKKFEAIYIYFYIECCAFEDCGFIRKIKYIFNLDTIIKHSLSYNNEITITQIKDNIKITKEPLIEFTSKQNINLFKTKQTISYANKILLL